MEEQDGGIKTRGEQEREQGDEGGRNRKQRKNRGKGLLIRLNCIETKGKVTIMKIKIKQGAKHKTLLCK